MWTGRIEAAEEIQLLLPENQPEAQQGGYRALYLGLGLLVAALPLWTRRRAATRMAHTASTAK